MATMQVSGADDEWAVACCRSVVKVAIPQRRGNELPMNATRLATVTPATAGAQAPTSVPTAGRLALCWPQGCRRFCPWGYALDWGSGWHRHRPEDPAVPQIGLGCEQSLPPERSPHFCRHPE